MYFSFISFTLLILNDLMKNMSKKKLKTSEPFGSALWPDLLRYRTFAVGSLQRHVRGLAYPATGRLQLSGVIVCILFSTLGKVTGTYTTNKDRLWFATLTQSILVRCVSSLKPTYGVIILPSFAGDVQALRKAFLPRLYLRQCPASEHPDHLR